MDAGSDPGYNAAIQFARKTVLSIAECGQEFTIPSDTLEYQLCGPWGGAAAIASCLWSTGGNEREPKIQV